MAKLKVGLVCPLDFSRRGGVQVCVLNLAGSLEKKGHETRVIAAGASTPSDFPVHAFGGFFAVPVNGTTTEVTFAFGKERARLRNFLRDSRFDILHYHHLWNPFLGFQVALCGEAAARASFITYHDTPSDSLTGKFLGKFVMPLASCAINRLFMDGVIAVSESPYQYLRIFDRNAHIIPNGVFVDEYAPGRNRPLERYLDGSVNILYVGRLDPRKGLAHLLEAFKRIKEVRRKTRLIIVGDGKLRGGLEARVRAGPLPGVEFAGEVTEEEKRRYYATCDIAAFPAPYGESMGIVLIEAMASGKPAVGAANSGYVTVLRDQARNLLFKPRDVEDLVDKLLVLIDNPGLRAELGRWGVEESKKYDSDRVAQRIEDLYYAAISRKPGP